MMILDIFKKYQYASLIKKNIINIPGHKASDLSTPPSKTYRNAQHPHQKKSIKGDTLLGP